jgi:hypothetical protein
VIDRHLKKAWIGQGKWNSRWCSVWIHRNRRYLLKRLNDEKEAMLPFNNKNNLSSIFDGRDETAKSVLDGFYCSTIDRNQSKHR